MTLRKRFLSLALVAGLAILSVACSDGGGGGTATDGGTATEATATEG